MKDADLELVNDEVVRTLRRTVKEEEALLASRQEAVINAEHKLVEVWGIDSPKSLINGGIRFADSAETLGY